jgi:Variant SH3 domain
MKSPKAGAEEMTVAQRKYEESTTLLQKVMADIEVQEASLLPPLQSLADLQKSYFEKSFACFSISQTAESVATGSSSFVRSRSSLKSAVWHSPEMPSSYTTATSLAKNPLLAEAKQVSKAVATNDKNGPIYDNQIEKSLTVLRRVQAVHSFNREPDSENEISITKGEFLDVFEAIDGGWLYGRNANGDKGIFPENYVCSASPHPIEDAPPPSQNPATPLKSSATLSHLPSYLDSIKSNTVDTTTIKQICDTCQCNEFSPNPFKKGQCNNCFHHH